MAVVVVVERELERNEVSAEEGEVVSVMVEAKTEWSSVEVRWVKQIGHTQKNRGIRMK